MRRATEDSPPELVFESFEHCSCDWGRSSLEDAVEHSRESYEDFWREYQEGVWTHCGVPKLYRDWTLATAPHGRGLLFLGQARLRLNAYLNGPVGTGKTGLAVGMLRDIVFGRQEPMRCLFTTAPDLLHQLRDRIGRNDGKSLGDMLWFYQAADVLVLDDLGAEKWSEWVEQTLYQLINHRYVNELQTIYTSNLGLSELADHIGSRSADRIADQCRGRVYTLSGGSLRLPS